jgi:small RNA 2'-O-methyltransferase
MAILTLNSDNKDFSYVIHKNPETGMIVKSCKQGSLFGWFGAPESYSVYFREGQNSVSFKREKDQDFEYINTERFISPQFVIQAIPDFFASALKNREELDTPGNHSLTLNLIHVGAPLYLKFFESQFDGLTVEHEEKGPKIYSVTLRTTKTINYLLNVSQLFAFFVVLTNREYIVFNNDLVKRYINILQSTEPPYFISYLFKKHCLRSRKNFDAEKVLLADTNRYSNIDFKFGGTLQNRVDVILEKTPLNEPVLDIGCGEGNYIREFGKKAPEISYIAVDTNEEVLYKSKKAVKRWKMENASTFESLDEAIKAGIPEGTNVLLTEVIEHMTVAEAEDLINKILSIKGVKSLLVTTPNKDFNQFYPLGEEFRHSDHKFEFTRQEWDDFTDKFDDTRSDEFFIGDEVNNIPTSFGIKFFAS